MNTFTPKNLIDLFPGRNIHYHPVLDSTNEEALRLITAGQAKHGLAVIAGAQTAGRGRNGRAFFSPGGKGLYVSLLLQPDCPAEELPVITPIAAVAVCEALERSAGIVPGIKWPNDVVCGGKKLCGILTEARAAHGGLWVILGIGLNLTQSAADFGPELAGKATSLSQLTGSDPLPSVAGELLRQLFRLADTFPRGLESAREAYHTRCVNPGREVILLSGDTPERAVCIGVNRDFSLQLLLPDGTERAVTSGEVSVRGIYGCE